MAVLYKVVEDTRDGSLTQGQWFGRAVHTNAINTKQIAEEIQENVSVKYSFPSSFHEPFSLTARRIGGLDLTSRVDTLASL